MDFLISLLLNLKYISVALFCVIYFKLKFGRFKHIFLTVHQFVCIHSMVTRRLFGPRVGREATWTVHPVASRGIRGPRPRRLRFYYLTDQRKARAPMDGRDRELCPPGGRGGRWAHVAHMGARRGVSCSALPVAVTAVKKNCAGMGWSPSLALQQLPRGRGVRGGQHGLVSHCCPLVRG